MRCPTWTGVLGADDRLVLTVRPRLLRCRLGADELERELIAHLFGGHASHLIEQITTAVSDETSGRGFSPRR